MPGAERRQPGSRLFYCYPPTGWPPKIPLGAFDFPTRMVTGRWACRVVPWSEVSAATKTRRKDRKPAWEADTGYEEETLNALFAGAEPFFSEVPDGNGGFKKRTRELWRAQHYFYIFFCYIHNYPTEGYAPTALRTSRLHEVSLDTTNASCR